MSDIFEDKIKEAVTARLDKLSAESKALWGKMTVVEMLTHMNDAFRVSLGMKPAKDRSLPLFGKAIFYSATYLLPAFPKNAKTAPEQNQEKGGSKPRDFYTEREFVKKMMDIFNEREANKFKGHPLFGQLSKKQWRDLFVKHFDHHLKQFGV